MHHSVLTKGKSDGNTAWNGVAVSLSLVLKTQDFRKKMQSFEVLLVVVFYTYIAIQATQNILYFFEK